MAWAPTKDLLEAQTRRRSAPGGGGYARRGVKHAIHRRIPPRMGIAKFLPCVLTALRVKCLREPERLILERKAIVVPPKEKPGEGPG